VALLLGGGPALEHAHEEGRGAGRADGGLVSLFTSSALRQRKLEVGNHDLRESGGRAALRNAKHLVHGAVLHVHRLLPGNGAWRQAMH
jgi:hypothetical protein